MTALVLPPSIPVTVDIPAAVLEVRPIAVAWVVLAEQFLAAQALAAQEGAPA